VTHSSSFYQLLDFGRDTEDVWLENPPYVKSKVFLEFGTFWSFKNKKFILKINEEEIKMIDLQRHMDCYVNGKKEFVKRIKKSFDELLKDRFDSLTTFDVFKDWVEKSKRGETLYFFSGLLAGIKVLKNNLEKDIGEKKDNRLSLLNNLYERVQKLAESFCKKEPNKNEHQAVLDEIKNLKKKLELFEKNSLDGLLKKIIKRALSSVVIKT
jgi:hypothetical protein